MKNHGVIKLDCKESFLQSNGFDTIPKLLLKIMVWSQYPNVNLFIGNREYIDDESDLPT